jgi:hypothetical protein
MRFRENGADIPAELLNAVSNGDTIFLCGAGVSKRAGLPLFDELTAQIYDAIGERRVDVAAERRAFDRAEYDRALRSLEKRRFCRGPPLGSVAQCPSCSSQDRASSWRIIWHWCSYRATRRDVPKC